MCTLQVHDQSSSVQQELVRAQLGWEPWSGTLYPGQGMRAAPKSPALAGTSLKLQVQLGGLGVSLVSHQHELLYGHITGIQARAVTGVTLELALQQGFGLNDSGRLNMCRRRWRQQGRVSPCGCIQLMMFWRAHAE